MKADMKIDIETLCATSGVRLLAGSPDKKLSAITSDSRLSDANSLFVPLHGEKFDGHDFIKELCEKKKCGAFLTENPSLAEYAAGTDTAVLESDNVLKSLGLIARGVRRKINPPVIGITGTNGKTTTKEILAHILQKKFQTHKNEKNYNNEIGVPFTLLKMKDTCNAAVIEMGMNHAGEIERLSAVVEPDIAIITSIGEGHLEFLGSVENVARAKAEIMKSMKKGSPVFINAAAPFCDFLVKEALNYQLYARTFGVDSSAEIYAETCELSETGISLVFQGVSMHIPLYGMHNVTNITAAVAVAAHMGMSYEEIALAFESFENVDGRSAVIDHGYRIIDDTYNANPLSMRMALDSVRQIYPDMRKIAVLSDMKELGAEQVSLHEETGAYAAACGFDVLLLWGEMSEAYQKGAKHGGMDEEKIHIFGTKEGLVRYLKSIISKKDVILIKGSRSMRMEEIAAAL